VNKVILLLIIIGFILIPSISYASYSNGFFGMIILYFTFPMPVIGLIFSFVFASKNKFIEDSFYFNYKVFWMILSFVIFMFSVVAFGGDDPASFLIIFIGLIIYNLIIFIPAFVQRYKNKG
jgi:hypothetical protein